MTITTIVIIIMRIVISNNVGERRLAFELTHHVNPEETVRRLTVTYDYIMLLICWVFV